jgi:hypothetical protein
LKINKKIIILVIIFVSICNLSFSQFYNGHQMNFGKNRVQYDKFEWYYYRFNRFDTYFYLGGNETALATEKIVNEAITDIENYLGQKLSKRIILILYQNLSDFRQSNIGLETGSANGDNLGGIFKISDNIIFIYNEGSLEQFKISIKTAIAKIILNEMVFGSNLRNKIANNALISVPNWYIEGLAALIAEDWNTDDENQAKNIISVLKIKNMNFLNSNESTIVGKSIWHFISTVYGKKVIPNLVYLTRVTKNVDNGFLYVLGLPFKTFQDKWLEFYKIQYQNFDETAENPDGKSLKIKNRKETETYQIANSYNSQLIAWAENKSGRYYVKILDLNTNKTKTIFRREHKLEQITDYSYPILKWHPSGKILGFIIEKKGQIYFTTYNIENKELKEIEMTSLEKITGFDYSNDGQLLVFSAFNNGQADLYLFNIAANTIENLTKDIADDFQPSFINKSTQIIYSSNRKIDEESGLIETQRFTNIFVYNIKSKKIEQITDSENSSETNPYFLNGQYLYLSDENGIKNLYSSKIDSAITFIDTLTHYSHFLNSSQLTNFKYSIKDINFDKFSEEFSFIYKNNNKYNFQYYSNLPKKVEQSQKNGFRKLFEKQNSQTQNTTQISVIQENIIKKNYDNPLDEPININNYSFEKEAIENNKLSKETEQQKKSENDKPEQEKKLITHKYFTTFYINNVVTQIDFGFLNNSYQQFTGSAFYFNPGFNLIFKVGTHDLFENYRITAGARFAGNFDSNEYLISFENLKKRWNKQIVLHRQVLENDVANNKKIKTVALEGFYIMRYPFSQVSAIQFTANIRQNKATFLSIDIPSLLEKDYFEYWGGLKTEYIFDNTKKISTNILSGSRIKIFGEFFNMLNKKKTDLFVFGGDARYYLPIYKNFIFAARLATSYSFGHSKLIYYLGGLDNWINFGRKYPTFDDGIRINTDENYVYQAVATNLRGFSQNIRNGCNFAVVNAELRLPIISFLFPRPITNDFLRNFQIIGFFDVGSAWSGLHPFSGNNAYQDDVYDYNSVSVTIHNNNYPIVSGFGFGIRSSIFGYFIRVDYAWGLENNNLLPPMYYFSLGLDF